MTDRLGELTAQPRGTSNQSSSEFLSGDSLQNDIENGHFAELSTVDLGSGDERDDPNEDGDRFAEIQSQEASEVQARLEAFKKEMDAISGASDKIEENVSEIDTKYKKSQIRGLSHAEKTALNGEISTLVAQTTKTSQAVRNRLGRIADENGQFAREFPENGASLKIRVTTHQAVTQRFMNVMHRLEEIQERHHDSIRTVIESQLRKFNPGASEQDIQNVLKQCDNDNNRDNREMIDSSPLLCQLPQDEQDKLRQQLQLLGERNRNIRQLEQDVIDLHQMFIDMKLLVDQQGELLNTIEYNVKETKGRAEAGMQEIIQAHDFQRRAIRKKWCIFFLVAAILVTIGIIVFAVYGRHWFASIGSGSSGDSVDSGEDSGADTGGTDTAGGDAETAIEPPASEDTGRNGINSSSSLPSTSGCQSNATSLQSVKGLPVSAADIKVK